MALWLVAGGSMLSGNVLWLPCVCRGRNFRTRIAATFDLVFLRLLVNSYTHALVSFEVDAADPQVVTRAGEPWQVFQSLAIGMYCLCVCIGENNQHVGTSFRQ